MTHLGAIRVEAQYKERVWGNQNLHPPGAERTDTPIGEAWIVYEGNRVASGPDIGLTLGEVAAKYGAQFLGRKAFERTGTRFPLLIKLLDCQAWLSVQVHPDDEKAKQLEGPEHFGKTEAWHFLKAEPGARIISGLRPGVTTEQVVEAIRKGRIVDLVEYVPVEQGETVLTLAGTVHALGPGLFVYEVQQTSDITYRIFDWNRPQAEGRALHIEQSVAVSNPTAHGISVKSKPSSEAEPQRLVECQYFTLDLIPSQQTPVRLDTNGETFHALTVIEGEIRAEGENWSETLAQYETIIVPAAGGVYTLSPRGPFRALLAKLP